MTYPLNEHGRTIFKSKYQQRPGAGEHQPLSRCALNRRQQPVVDDNSSSSSSSSSTARRGVHQGSRSGHGPTDLPSPATLTPVPREDLAQCVLTENQSYLIHCLVRDQSHMEFRFAIKTEDLNKLKDASYRVQLRFNLPYRKTSFSLTHLTVVINDIFISVPEMEVKSRGTQPIDITRHCFSKGVGSNDLTVMTRRRHTFWLSVEVAKVITVADVKHTLERRGPSQPDCTAALIRKLAADSTEEVTTSAMKFSLLCPISKTRMVIPCRSKDCIHIQCFDLLNFLQLNTKNSKWCCPVCNETVSSRNLQIDGYFRRVLQSTRADTIIVRSNGSWAPLESAERGQELEIEAAPTVRPETEVPSEAPGGSPPLSREILTVDLSETDSNEQPCLQNTQTATTQTRSTTNTPTQTPATQSVATQTSNTRFTTQQPTTKSVATQTHVARSVTTQTTTADLVPSQDLAKKLGLKELVIPLRDIMACAPQRSLSAAASTTAAATTTAADKDARRDGTTHHRMKRGLQAEEEMEDSSNKRRQMD